MRSTTVVSAVLAATVASAYPSSLHHATIHTRAEDLKDEYDYVIVGGGTAGLTVGDRLSESGKYSVLAIEYGYLEHHGYRPGRTTYNITSLPSPALNNRTFNVGIGCIVGGSSAVNGQVFQRGTAGDYDLWGELGGGEEMGSTWNWESMLKYFKKGIYFTPPREDMAEAYNITYDLKYWGQDEGTRIYATFTSGLEPGLITMYEAMKSFPGVDTPVDGGSGKNGLVWFTTSMDPVTFDRSYSRTGHWDNLNRTNYDLVTATKVTKVLFDDNVATGVQIHPRDEEDKLSKIRARKEVILAAGAIHTPQILMLSGIGPKELLDEAGIDLMVELPGVGHNFQDHHYIPGISYSWGKEPPTPKVDAESIDNGFGIALGAFLGMKAVSPDKVKSLARKVKAQAKDPASLLPEGTHETVVAGYGEQLRRYADRMSDNSISFLECMLSSNPGCSPQNVHPLSRGTVLINTTNPQGEMLVDYRAASNPLDLDIMVEDIKFFRRYMMSKESDLAKYEAEETQPGLEDFGTDDELKAWAREEIIPSVYHPIGTAAKMPREWGGVVSEELEVYGVKGLSVVDASIMPTIVGSTTSMTVYAIAEKAADLIKARA